LLCEPRYWFSEDQQLQFTYDEFIAPENHETESDIERETDEEDIGQPQRRRLIGRDRELDPQFV
jgi:hypothetical protein